MATKLPDDIWYNVFSFYNPMTASISRRHQRISDGLLDQNFRNRVVYHHFTVWNRCRRPSRNLHRRAVSLRHFLYAIFSESTLRDGVPGTRQIIRQIHHLRPKPSKEDCIQMISALSYSIWRTRHIHPDRTADLETVDGRSFRSDSVPENSGEKELTRLLFSPKFFLPLSQLKTLRLQASNIHVVPNVTFFFSQITKLYIRGCRDLTHNPLTLSGFHNIRVLDLSGYIPDINHFGSTRECEQHAHIVHRPTPFQRTFGRLDSLRQLPQLRALKLDDTCIKTLPPLHRFTPKLEILSVNNCFFLKKLPSNLALHPGLKKICIKNCYSLRTIPASLKERVESGHLELSTTYLLVAKQRRLVTLKESEKGAPTVVRQVELYRSSTPAINGDSSVNYNDRSIGRIREPNPYNQEWYAASLLARTIFALNFGDCDFD